MSEFIFSLVNSLVLKKKKAIPFLGMAFFIVLGPFDILLAQSKKPVAKSDTGAHKGSRDEVIAKAQELAIDKKRSQALELLLKSELKDRQHHALGVNTDFVEIFSSIGSAFFQESTQQVYEVALSGLLANPSQVVPKLTEALKIEPDNLTIQLALARQLIRHKDCNKADEIISKLKPYTPLSYDIQLAQLQVSFCKLGKISMSDDGMELAVDPSSGDSLVIYFWELQLEKLKQQLNPGNRGTSSNKAVIQKMKSLIEKIKKFDSNYPEIIRWESEMAETKSEQLNLLMKYQNVCKGLNISTYRKYLKNPFLCRELLVYEK